ncbi:MAG TPA: hypothetical protein VFL34_09115 [Candidatus Sulfotelmatobacter sp.]|nr:hypothetical protein [Candidatus Sulfotelmatobacter sp.]
MKPYRVLFFCALFVAVCLSTSVQAQVRVDVPFNFVAAGKLLPAGHYIVEPVFDADRSVWRVTNGSVGVILLTNPGELLKSPQRRGMVFFFSDGRFSLIELRTSDSESRELPLRAKVTTRLKAEAVKYIEIEAE